MALAPPPPVSTNPVRRLAADWRAERRTEFPFPPGDTTPSLKRTQQAARDPLPLLLDAYERHGPVFTLRIFHQRVVFMIGPEANHHMLVSHADNFRWRDGHMGDLIPLLGDGLLTIDGDFHRRSRKAMLPAFHRDRIAAATTTILDEAAAGVAQLRAGDRVDVYAWTRRLALRIAMRALFGFDPDRATNGVDMAHDFEVGLGYYSRDYFLQTLRGPATPFWRMQRARERLDAVIFAEIARRRATGERGEDLLSLLLDARDEDGRTLDDQHVRDEVMTLLFAGHDTTTSTVAFLLYELARNSAELDAVLDELGNERIGPEHLGGTALPRLEMAIDETLRLYPPAWIGPRRAVKPFVFKGIPVPGDVFVEYCSWASHRLPEVFDDPHTFRSDRMTPENKAKLPKGAYVPFGGGSRTCIGMRFGQVEVRALAALLLQKGRPVLEPGYTLRISQSPTIGPRDGLPMRLQPR